MKKVLAVLLAALMLTGTCACGKDDTPKATGAQQEEKGLGLSVYDKDNFSITIDSTDVTNTAYGVQVNFILANSNKKSQATDDAEKRSEGYGAYLTNLSINGLAIRDAVIATSVVAEEKMDAYVGIPADVCGYLGIEKAGNIKGVITILAQNEEIYKEEFSVTIDESVKDVELSPKGTVLIDSDNVKMTAEGVYNQAGNGMGIVLCYVNNSDADCVYEITNYTIGENSGDVSGLDALTVRSGDIMLDVFYPPVKTESIDKATLSAHVTNGISEFVTCENVEVAF